MKRASIAAMVCTLTWLRPVGAGEELPVRVRAQVDEAATTIGDPIAYTVTIQHAPQVRVRPPRADADLGPFEVREYRVEKQPGETRAIYELAVYDVGPQTIPALEAAYIAEDGQGGSVKTEPVTVSVESVLPADAKDILDIRGPKDVETSPIGVIIGALLCLVALAAVLVGVRLWRGGRRPAAEKHGPPSPPPRPPEDVAYEELDVLVRSDLLARGMLKAYYSELGDILRRYVEGLYGVPALESTTQEMVSELPDAGVAAEATKQFARTLGECDLVKFAKHRPSGERCDEALDDARCIIDLTKPRRTAVPSSRLEPPTGSRRIGRPKRHDVQAGR